MPSERAAPAIGDEIAKLAAPAVELADPVRAAETVGLTYVGDDVPGIRRRRAGRGFAYRNAAGRVIRDAETLARIRRLAVPPAWTEVWICPNPRGHIQATGRDARGRKQYRYHRLWREVRDETKFHRMLAFGAALPSIRRHVERDLGREGLPRDKVLATVVRLLESTLIRVGNDEYARDNGSYGLTTLRDDHVRVDGTRVFFRFRGKSGKERAVSISDRRIASIVRRCQDLPGHELFQYVCDDGTRQRIRSEDVNAYLRAITGEDFTAKDFRTWAATVLAACALRTVPPFASRAQSKRAVAKAMDAVARQLGNTRSICQRCYVHPAIVETYLDGSLAELLTERAPRDRQVRDRSLSGLLAEEAAVMLFLVAWNERAAEPLAEKLRASLRAA